VTDDDGGVGSDTFTVTVNNRVPTVEAGADQIVGEGSVVSLAPSAFNDLGTLDTHTADINWGDGTPTETGVVSEDPFGPPGDIAGMSGTVSGSHVYADNGIYTVTVTVTGPDQIAGEGSVVSLAPSAFNDLGTLDTHTATINWGDNIIENVVVSETPFGPPGSPDGADGTVAGSHVYADDGTYTVTITVTDDDGGAGSDTFTVTVNNRVPTVEAGADQTVNEGSAVSLAPSTFNDLGTLDGHTATINWGDNIIENGVVSETPFGPPGDIAGMNGTVFGSHIYADSGVYTVTVKVTDDDGGAGSDIFTVTVNNQVPTVEAGADQIVAEGDKVKLALSTFNDLLLDTHTAIIDWDDGTATDIGIVSEFPFNPPDAAVGMNGTVSGSHVYADNGIYTVRVTVTDDDGDAGSDTFTVTVTNAAPEVDAGLDQTVEAGAPVSLAPATFIDPGTLDTHSATIDWAPDTPTETGVVTESPFGPPGSTAGATGTVSGSHVYAEAGVYTVTVTVEDDEGASVSDTMTVTVTEAVLLMSVLQPTTSGFEVQFNRPLDPGSLNLYGTETGGFGPADVTVVGAVQGPVNGSLVVDAALGHMTFIRTGGILEPDTYTVTLRSAADGFKDSLGYLLDGDQDGTPGDDHVSVFTVDPSSAVVVSVPDFARGPGQAVDVPASGSGIPIRLNDGNGVESIDLTLTYDPSLLTVTAVSPGASLPVGSLVQGNLSVPGQVTISMAAVTGLAAGPIDIATLTAEVPATAPYRAKHIIDITRIGVNEGTLPAVADSGLHVTAYFGDTTGSGTYSALDGQRLLRVAAGLDTGFAKFPMLDPVVVGDITGIGTISALDATRILQEVVGLDRPEIPPLPGILVPEPVADPLVDIPTDLSGLPGDMVTVPINIDVADGLEAVDLQLAYDTSVLDLADAGVRKAELTADGLFIVNLNEATGTLRMALALITPRPAGGGKLFELDYQITSTASPGTTPIDLQSVSLNEGELVLTPAPVPGSDATDGLITINEVNEAPELAADNVSVTVNEGDTAANSGTVSDPDSDEVDLTASVGAVVDNGDGTWSWSFDTTDGPDESQTVTITAEDDDGAVTTTTFELQVNDVAPTFTIDGDSSVTAGEDYTLDLTVTDPGGDPIASWVIDWGDGTVETVPGDHLPPSHIYQAPMPLPGDFDGDGVVSRRDRSIFRANFGQTGANLPGDFDGDGVVSRRDRSVFRANFGLSGWGTYRIVVTAIDEDGNEYSLDPVDVMVTP
jgi:PKD repeat protein